MTETARAEGIPANHRERVGATLAGGFVAVFVTLVISWFVFAAMYGVAVGTTPSSSPGPSRAPTPATIYLTISTLPSGADQYMPANFSVPSGVPVTFVISSYDNGVNNVSTTLSTVAGTVGGTESILGGAPGTPQGSVASVPLGDTSHTFSVLSGGINLNAVIPPAVDPSIAVQVTFTVVFPQSGAVTWNCLAPCDPWSMATPGFMGGMMTLK